MATLPENIGFATQLQYVSRPSATWLINRQLMRVQSNTDGLQAVRQAVEIILNTERFRWQIYSDRMGSETDELIGDDSSYIESELPRMVTDALMVDDRVIEVADFAYTTAGDTMTWSFTVHTVFGVFSEELTL